MEKNELEIKRLLSVIEDLESAIEDLKQKVDVLETYSTAKRCKSCQNWYLEDTICECGRDNSYTNEEWKRRE